ncbi:MAG TPA: TetR family transcriptional regulator [Jatrophihabitantaceae bacterium]|nr:TetR family transcriptional regulator [Jatrophihabitantaceae bacterium]
MSNDVVAADGRIIGERALATRRRLLDATESLLERDGVRDLKVVDISREVGSAPATFYQYFADIDSAILALADEAAEDSKELIDMLDPVWSDAADIGRARAFLDAYVAHWRARHAALRIANLRADEGDERFRKSRVKAYLVLLDRMIAIVTAAQKAGRIDKSLDSYTIAVSTQAMLDRLMSYETSPRSRQARQRLDFDSVARMLFQALTGHPA